MAFTDSVSSIATPGEFGMMVHTLWLPYSLLIAWHPALMPALAQNGSSSAVSSAFDFRQPLNRLDSYRCGGSNGPLRARGSDYRLTLGVGASSSPAGAAGSASVECGAFRI